MLNYTFSLVDFEILILILVRISCFVYAAPFFGMKNVPSRVKIGLSFLLSILIFPSVDQSAVTYTGMFGYAVIVLREGITGLLMGFAANICNSIILLREISFDMDIGTFHGAGVRSDDQLAGHHHGKSVSVPAASDDGRDEHASLCTAGAH